MFKRLRTQLSRIAYQLELANGNMAAANEIAREQLALSQEVLAFQREMQEEERSHTVVHVRPDIGTLTTEVSKELSKQMRRSAGSKQA